MTYSAESIEVLSGLEPVQRRPGMYTETDRPNHLAREVIDNSVDEALAGHAKLIEVIHYKDGSLSVTDDGRGMPVDKHPKFKVSGVELIMTRLHAGGKFSNKNYRFSGGLHGVGISVVNALSQKLEVEVKQNGKQYHMAFAHGKATAPLKPVGEVGRRQTGTTVRFWPEKKYFDSPRFSMPHLKNLLRSKAILCPGLRIIFREEGKSEHDEWCFESGLSEYLEDSLKGLECLPAQPFVGSFSGEREEVDWAVNWLPEGGDLITESYVNLVPTMQGGTHVNGLRQGILDALREFCDIHNLLPRGIKLVAEDVWNRCCYVLSVKLEEAQFSGQTKERLSSRECATFVSGVVKDALSLWLNQHVAEGEQLAQLVIASAQQRLRARKKVERKRVTAGPALPGKLSDCVSQDPIQGELFLVEGDSAGGSAKQARDREFQAVLPLRGKVLNTWEVDSGDILSSQSISHIAIAMGIDPDETDLSKLRYHKICILADADSDGAHIATLLCALFVRHFRPLVEAGHVYVAMPPLYRIDVGKKVYYALDDAEKDSCVDRIASEKQRGKVNIQRFKGLGEMNPSQLRETTMDPLTRRLVRLVVTPGDETQKTMDMLLSKKRAGDRKTWLEAKGNLAEV